MITFGTSKRKTYSCHLGQTLSNDCYFLNKKKIKTLGGMKEGKSYNSREANPMACIWYLPNIVAFNMLKILFLYFTAMTTTHSIWFHYAKYPSVHISD